MHACKDGHEFASEMAGKLYGAMMARYKRHAAPNNLLFYTLKSVSQHCPCCLLIAQAAFRARISFLSYVQVTYAYSKGLFNSRLETFVCYITCLIGY